MNLEIHSLIRVLWKVSDATLFSSHFGLKCQINGNYHPDLYTLLTPNCGGKKTKPCTFRVKTNPFVALWTLNLPLFSHDESSSAIPQPWSREAREEKYAPADHFSVLLWIYQLLVLSVDLKMTGKADKQPVYLWRLFGLIITEGNTAQSGAQEVLVTRAQVELFSFRVQKQPIRGWGTLCLAKARKHHFSWMFWTPDQPPRGVNHRRSLYLLKQPLR